jgi:hypothetical protein
MTRFVNWIYSFPLRLYMLGNESSIPAVSIFTFFLFYFVSFLVFLFCVPVSKDQTVCSETHSQGILDFGWKIQHVLSRFSNHRFKTSMQPRVVADIPPIPPSMHPSPRALSKLQFEKSQSTGSAQLDPCHSNFPLSLHVFNLLVLLPHSRIMLLTLNLEIVQKFAM